MQYKILAGTETHNKLSELQAQKFEANKKAFEMAERFGAKQYIDKGDVVAGGLTGFILPDGPPDKSLWRKAYTAHYRDVYFPMRNRKANKDLLAEIDALPVVSDEDLNSVLGYQSGKIKGTNVWTFKPGYAYHIDYALVKTHEKYSGSLSADFIEILASEFNELSKIFDDPETSAKDDDDE